MSTSWLSASTWRSMAASAFIAVIDIDRDAAREAARRELAKAKYRADEPGLLERALSWLDKQFEGITASAERATFGAGVGWWLLLLLVVVLAVVIFARVGRPSRAAARDGSLFLTPTRSAADYRSAAERHATAGEWAEAVRDRLRAVVRSLEERGLLENRPGRTADEVADEAGAMLPTAHDSLRAAARVFDEIWYGKRTATAEAYATVRNLDDALPTHREVVRV